MKVQHEQGPHLPGGGAMDMDILIKQLVHSARWATPALKFTGASPGAGWRAEHRPVLGEPLGIQAKQVTVAGEREERAES